PDACDAHHLIAWLLGGATDLENLTLLCRRHHSDNDDSRADPRRGHMTPRTNDPRGRTGWAHPIGADGRRNVEFNDGGTLDERAA
ncbi:MAG TPA: HNH endonuclease, partial [Candidatus Dietzia merdigallinarum]|nr:HNH endonuclease [Candidatus Dietzia merdigallinarum]